MIHYDDRDHTALDKVANVLFKQTQIFYRRKFRNVKPIDKHLTHENNYFNLDL